MVTEKNKKSCTFCLNTALLPNHTRPTCPKLIKYGCAPISDESLVAFEQKSNDFLVERIPFNASAIATAIPNHWVHVVVVDDFLAPVADGMVRICELMGLNEIGDPVLDQNIFVPLPTVRTRFEKNMSKAQAKKTLLICLKDNNFQNALQQDKENVAPNMQLLCTQADEEKQEVLLDI